MTRVLPRTTFHSSSLIRCLADLDMADPADPGNAFAEKLGAWVHFTDAINLSTVHGEAMTDAPARRPAQAGAYEAIAAEFNRTQSFLATSITNSCSFKPGRSHVKLPAPILELPLDTAAAYMPYRRFYETHQRDMESSIQPLRTNIRAALAQASPRLRKLAELDAAFERILRERESKLLARVPLLLKKRFQQLFNAHRQRLDDAGQADNPAGWTRPGAWLARFCEDMQMLLLAETELRLQPAMGLIEAYKQDTQ